MQQNSTLRYTYGLPSAKNRSTSFSWDYLDWSSCSTECGPGLQTSVPKCVEKISGLVDESFCKNQLRLKDQTRPCEIAPCIPRWFVGEFGDCEHCPTGTRTRIVKCYRPVGTGEGELDIIADSFCANNKPKTSESCSCKRDKRDDNSTTSTNDTSTSTPTTTITTNTPVDGSGNTGNTTQSTTCITESNTTTINPNTTITEEYDPFGMDVSTTSTPMPTVTTPKIKTVVDFINFKHAKLTIHTELENGKYPQGLSHPKNSNETRYEYTGKDALKFLNTMQHDFSNNKTKI